MKKIIPFVMLIIFSITTTSAQSSKAKKDPSGEWKFKAQYAPEGYSDGKITVGTKEKNYSVAITFTGSEYKVMGENVRFVNDSLLFSIYVEGENVTVKIKMEDASKMTGTALYSQGEISLTATRDSK